MEYVANAKGETITVASGATGPTEQPAPVSSNAPAAAAASVAPLSPAVVAPSTVSTLAEVEAFYQKELARVEAEAAVIKRFASNVMAQSKSDVVAVESMPKAIKVAAAVLFVIACVAGFIAGKLL